MADLKLFGEPFARVSGTIREQLYISTLRSELFGDISATHAVERANFGDNNFRVCSVMREYTLRKRDLLLCEETEKPRLEAYREAWTVKSPEDLLAEFPTTIAQRQDRILQNLHVMAPNYGDTIDQPPHQYDCFAKTPQEYFFFLELLRDNELITVNILPRAADPVRDVSGRGRPKAAPRAPGRRY